MAKLPHIDVGMAAFTLDELQLLLLITNEGKSNPAESPEDQQLLASINTKVKGMLSVAQPETKENSP